MQAEPNLGELRTEVPPKLGNSRKIYEGLYNDLLYGIDSNSHKTPARGFGCLAKIDGNRFYWWPDLELNQGHEDFQAASLFLI